MFTSLLIKDLEFPIHLGWSAEEREHLQTIVLDIELFFKQIPLACQTDHIADTICYDHLITSIKTHLQTTCFCLIEHVAAAIYHYLKNTLPTTIAINIHLIKRPPIPELKGYVRFSMGDKGL